MRHIKTGIVGMGSIGPVHLEALRRLGSIDICVATSNKISAREASQKFGIDEVYSSWEDMLTNAQLEVIHICTPNALHFPIAKRAIQMGKHVICDKPLTLDINQACELLTLAKEAGIVHATTFNTSYYPLITQAAHLVASGQIGNVHFLQGNYLQDWLMNDSDYNWRVEASLGGPSRVIGDIGSHWLFLIQKIIGQKITRVFADFNQFIPYRERPQCYFKNRLSYDTIPVSEAIRVDTEDQATLILEFDRGAKGVFVGGQTFAGHKNKLCYEIYGSKKSMAWDAQNPNGLWVGEREEANRLLMKDFNLLEPHAAAQCDFTGGLQEGVSETWKNLFRLVYEAIRKNEPVEGVYPTFTDGLQIQRIVNASYDSSLKSQWVEV